MTLFWSDPQRKGLEEAEMGHTAHSFSAKWFSTYPRVMLWFDGDMHLKSQVCPVTVHFTDLSFYTSGLYNYRVLDLESSCWQVKGNSVQYQFTQVKPILRGIHKMGKKWIYLWGKECGTGNQGLGLFFHLFFLAIDWLNILHFSRFRIRKSFLCPLSEGPCSCCNNLPVSKPWVCSWGGVSDRGTEISFITAAGFRNSHSIFVPVDPICERKWWHTHGKSCNIWQAISLVTALV